MMFERTQKEQNKLDDIVKLYPKNECPFCSDKFLELNYIVKGFEDLEHWHLIHNIAPYKDTKKHYVLVLKRHLDNNKFYSITDKEMAEFNSVMIYLSYMSLIHHGTEKQSQRHLHFH